MEVVLLVSTLIAVLFLELLRVIPAGSGEERSRTLRAFAAGEVVGNVRH